MKYKLLTTTILITVLMLPVKGQIIKSKLDLVAGISAREYLHAGLRYQYTEITQIGVNIGSDLEFVNNEDITTFNIDHMLHFGKHNYYSNRPVWYYRMGYTLINNKIGDYSNINYHYLNMGVGREIAFSDRLGVNFDLGFNWQFRKYTKKPSLETPINNRLYTIPMARMQLFFSL